MNDNAFWKLIGRIDRAALAKGDEDRALKPLVDALSAYGVTDIQDFEDLLAKHLYDLDGRAHADAAGEAGDRFLYARSYVIAQGRDQYLRIKQSPGQMPRSPGERCQGLVDVPKKAWAASTGKEEKAWTHVPPLDTKTGSNEKLRGRG